MDIDDDVRPHAGWALTQELVDFILNADEDILTLNSFEDLEIALWGIVSQYEVSE